MTDIATANATMCATLVDEWVRGGLTHAVISPGSRSTPLALAIVASGLRVEVVHDERVAGFIALGLGVELGRPSVLLCTSGTAAVNLAPAVVEAGLSDVAMLVVTADRPPELRGVGAPQTIDQVNLYGSAVGWFADPPPPDASDPATWRPLAQQALDAATNGPAHLNLPFREPLVGTPANLPPPLVTERPRLQPSRTERPRLQPSLDRFREAQRGVVVAGGRSGVSAVAVGALAERLGWPILADPMSGLRRHPNAVPAFDAILRSDEFARAHAPQVVVRVGRPPASKVLSTWTAAAPVMQIGGPGVIDPDHNVVERCTIDDLDVLTGATNTPWLARWRRASERAEATIDHELGDTMATEPLVARTVAGAIEPGERLVVSSSMPVRDLEWFGGPAAAAHANRGANGIDGVISTAVGIALTGVAVTVLIGDIAFVHDTNALTALAARGVTLRIVVVDNDGGGIFSFLPQANKLPRDRFEFLFGTPHGTDVLALARAHGAAAVEVSDVAELRAALRAEGVTVIRVATDRAANHRLHQHLNQTIAASL